MKMYIKSVMVDDQAKALAFYTDILGFDVKHNIPWASIAGLRLSRLRRQVMWNWR